MEPLIAILITIVVMFVAWLALGEKKAEREHEEVKYDECAECHHLIAKGSGQVVEYSYHFGMYSLENNHKDIYCNLHKKPYDEMRDYGTVKIYKKKVEPWKRVNEDGTDYKEPEITVNYKNLDNLARWAKRTKRDMKKKSPTKRDK